MIQQLHTPLFLYTPKGKALCHFVIDYGIEHDLLWVCFLQDSGECWTFSNKDVKSDVNITIGRKYAATTPHEAPRSLET